MNHCHCCILNRLPGDSVAGFEGQGWLDMGRKRRLRVSGRLDGQSPEVTDFQRLEVTLPEELEPLLNQCPICADSLLKKSTVWRFFHVSPSLCWQFA
jgi:hypothetical protein